MLGALICYDRAPDVPLGISRSVTDAAVRRGVAVLRFLRRGASVLVVAVVLTGVIRMREIVCTMHQFAWARITQVGILLPYFPFRHPELPFCFELIHAGMDRPHRWGVRRAFASSAQQPSYLQLSAQNPAFYGFSRKDR